MAKKKSYDFDFDDRGGVLRIPKRMVESESFTSLSSSAKALILCLHSHWSFYKPIDMGVRGAGKMLNCSKDVAGRALKELESNKFIVMHEPSNFIHSSSLGNRPKSWILTWVPFHETGRSATKEWEQKK
ncbi:MAG: hypothetical protein QM504_17430 [Pseudomonadota bacterium]